ncbi:MAG TPA: bifunctional UDP-N-acetylglucosamine diphosphorylase/glucosamine-1-phosphate N-acetyltransferase GlmU [Firmicutes bacterium]|nr:bifunctional UDP-N-acetylglucosamine diphosphorylase/glucosamine-1-phosphate N-acetyltransferase GlmU [Bacillota bacterium]
MKSKRAKVLHELCGKPMISYVVEALKPVCDSIIAVVGHQADAVQDALRNEVHYAYQREQLGTAHALLQTKCLLQGFKGNVLVACGDTPFVTQGLFRELLGYHVSSGAAVTVATFHASDPTGYGRIIRDASGELKSIVEERDATDQEKGITEVNSGIYCFDCDSLFSALERTDRRNAQGEFYLTQAVEIMIRDGLPARCFVVNDPGIVEGINDRRQLAAAQKRMRLEILRKLMLSGVTVEDPETTYVDARATAGQDTVIRAGTRIEGASVIGEECDVGPDTCIIDSKLGNRCKVWYSVIEECILEDDVQVGPYSHLRPNSHLENSVYVGNFAEIKNTRVGEFTKVHHHCYLGDSIIGKKVNIGAGTVTVNYDGKRKHTTVIRDGAFVGCNANLIAPVTIGEGAYVAAGSTINKEVPEEALGIARSRQENKPGWAKKFLGRG